MINNKLLAGTLAIVMIAGLGHTGLIIPVYAQTLLSGTADLSKASEFSPSQFPLVDCNVDSGDIVAIDVSKAALAGTYSVLLNELQIQGFIVREVNISTQGIPDCIVKLFITPNNFGFCIPTSYTAAEGTLVANWVNNGGALLVLNELDFCRATDEITLALGETPNGNNEFFTHIAGTNYDQTNPASLFSSVNSWEYLAGTDYQPSSDSVATDGVFPAGDPTMLVKKIGTGCTIITGDSNWPDDIFIGDFDHMQLAVNSFIFLNECIAPIVGGELLPIDSTALLLASAQSTSWMIPLVLSILGIGLFVVSRNRTNDLQ